MKSPAFSDFRELMDTWDEAVDKQQIQDMIDGNNFVFFFDSKGVVFGGPEESRLTFAKMKNPDDDLPKEWAKEANFAAINFDRALEGDKVKSVFGSDSLKDLKVLERDAVVDILVKKAQKLDKKKIKVKNLGEPEKKHPEDPANPKSISKVKEQ